MKTFAVKCEKTITFYINVEAENEWQAQHKAEYEHREGRANDDGFVGSSRIMSDIRTIHAVEVDDADS